MIWSKFHIFCQFSAIKMAFFSKTYIIWYFLPIFGDKNGVFLKNLCYDQNFVKFWFVLSQTRQFFHLFYWRKYFKNHKIDPRCARLRTWWRRRRWTSACPCSSCRGVPTQRSSPSRCLSSQKRLYIPILHTFIRFCHKYVSTFLSFWGKINPTKIVQILVSLF
jgi:hypothetical protein